jgi:hypothetical protein
MEQSAFLFLSWPLDDLGWSAWSDSSLFVSLLLWVASSAMAYLLVIANISSDVLEFFVVRLWIKDESLSPFLRSMIIDMSSTSEMMFLLLQKHWINSQRGSPFFQTTLARS